MSEKRYAPRVTLRSVARLSSGSSAIKCVVVNISASGMAIETKQRDRLDRFIRLTLQLVEGAPAIDLDAIVRRKEGRGSSVRWGLEFHEPPPYALAQIAEYVANKRADNPPTPQPFKQTAAAPPPSETEPRCAPSDSATALKKLYDEALFFLGA